MSKDAYGNKEWELSSEHAQNLRTVRQGRGCQECRTKNGVVPCAGLLITGDVSLDMTHKDQPTCQLIIFTLYLHICAAGTED